MHVHGYFGCVRIVIILSILFIFIARVSCAAGPYKVLVVMSYHEEMPWEKEIREGIEAELKDSAEIRYFYMNTKNDPDGGVAKAKEAYRIYSEFQPDGVIAADDDAQWLFVVPYLKNKVRTPVVFCGVNAEPDKYGYPAVNVTGILERAHFRESISYLQQLMPKVKSIGFMVTDNQTGLGYMEQVRKESKSYPVSTQKVSLVKTLDEALKAVRVMRNQYDALFLIALEGLTNMQGKPLAERESFPILVRAFGKPVIGINKFNIRYHMLCAVVKTGHEQGSTASQMLLQALKGTPVSALPITRNQHGERVLNITVMKSLGIKPRPFLLVGTDLVESAE
jgi:ABC-type uncharacterized transport system substrate-binding protein